MKRYGQVPAVRRVSLLTDGGRLGGGVVGRSRGNRLNYDTTRQRAVFTELALFRGGSKAALTRTEAGTTSWRKTSRCDKMYLVCGSRRKTIERQTMHQACGMAISLLEDCS
jgi:hypothetical protein